MEKNISNFSLYIIGTTATGKTKLSLALGKKFGGQIVSADSMQMYRKADILTAKATLEEQSIVKHHMLDIFDLGVSNFNRNDYFHIAQRCLQRIYMDKSFPIIIGGTNYYIETLLFLQKIAENRIDLNDPNEFILKLQSQNEIHRNSSSSKSPNVPQDIEKVEQEMKNDDPMQQLEQMTIQEKYEELKKRDPLLANKLHPNDERRINNYLQQTFKTGISPSQEMQDHESVPLRDKNCLILWPRCKSQSKLEVQIRKRILEMVNEDGIYEAIYIFQQLLPPDVTSEDHPLFLKGVLQSIGYKEFFPFYQLYRSKNYPKNISREQNIDHIKQLMKDDVQGKQVINQCIEKLVVHTTQYTKRQLKWIRHRIMINSDSEEIKQRLYVFEFDEFNSEDFQEKVIDPAIEILSRYFKLTTTLSDSCSLSPIEDLAKNDEFAQKYLIKPEELLEVRKGHFKKGLKDWKNYYCEECKKQIFGDLNWSIHSQSRKHKRTVKSKEKSYLRSQNNQNQLVDKEDENNFDSNEDEHILDEKTKHKGDDEETKEDQNTQHDDDDDWEGEKTKLNKEDEKIKLNKDDEKTKHDGEGEKTTLNKEDEKTKHDGEGEKTTLNKEDEKTKLNKDDEKTKHDEENETTNDGKTNINYSNG